MPRFSLRRAIARRRSAVRRGSAESGQALVLFVLGSLGLIGGVALVTDASWLWYGQQRMQRAADAASLAGAIHLPGDVTSAYNAARNEAVKNGFTNGANGVVVTPLQDTRNRRRLIVTVSGNVSSYFARALGFSQFSAAATSRAEYVLPVPMGSPQNYYGVGYFVDPVTETTNNRINGQSDWRPEGGTGNGTWSNPGNAASNNNSYATATNNDQLQSWSTFGLGSTSQIPNEPSLVVDGLEVRLTDVSIQGSGTSTNCRVRVETSWKAGTNWSTANVTSALTTTEADDRTIGSSSSTSAWGGHTWTRSDFSDANFRVRLTWLEGGSSCATSRSVRLDLLEVRVNWHWNDAETTLSGQHIEIDDPNGNNLEPQNFWGSMQTQGAPSIQGDAYMTKYAIRTSTLNGPDGTEPDARYAPEEYYSYGVEFPAGAAGGQVWIFDPGFCDVTTRYGTGESWTIGGANGADDIAPASAYFDLYDTRATPYDYNDDSLVASSGNDFERSFNADGEVWSPDVDVDPNEQQYDADDCRDESWHHGWYRLAAGLSGGGSGRTYRLHSYSTDLGSPNDQNQSTALNGFAFWATSSGGLPKIYGIGAMEAYIRLPGGQSSEFYLAQIERQHAGKTMVIDLWDPGDTGNLAANLQILEPTASNYSPVQFSYEAERGTTASAASDCNSRSGTGVNSVTTNTGGSSQYNGCWLTITIQLPNTYTAPHPSSDNVTNEGGWWKIRYNMSGDAGDRSTDLTTWQVTMRGSPVHLVIP